MKSGYQGSDRVAKFMPLANLRGGGGRDGFLPLERCFSGYFSGGKILPLAPAGGTRLLLTGEIKLTSLLLSCSLLWGTGVLGWLVSVSITLCC